MRLPLRFDPLVHRSRFAYNYILGARFRIEREQGLRDDVDVVATVTVMERTP